MTGQTRAEHLAWCKQRALEYLPDNPNEAFASMLSDLTKHPETQDHIGLQLGMQMKLSGFMETEREVRSFIEGFN